MVDFRWLKGRAGRLALDRLVAEPVLSLVAIGRPCMGLLAVHMVMGRGAALVMER